MTSDVQLFEEALGRGDLARAVELYTGPFLDGVYLSEAGEFERWVEAERSRLATLMARALESLARNADGRGDHRSAADWWRRFAALDPLSSRAALGLMTTLDRAGEPVEAIRAGRAHTEFVRQELGAEPATEVTALMERLQHFVAGEFATVGAFATSDDVVSINQPYNVLTGPWAGTVLFNATKAFSVGAALWVTVRRRRGGPTPIAGGVASAVAVGLFGNLDAAGQILGSLRDGLGLRAAADRFDFWQSTRIIPGTINEFPFFSGLWADLHAHVPNWSVSTALLVGVVLMLLVILALHGNI